MINNLQLVMEPTVGFMVIVPLTSMIRTATNLMVLVEEDSHQMHKRTYILVLVLVQHLIMILVLMLHLEHVLLVH